MILCGNSAYLHSAPSAYLHSAPSADRETHHATPSAPTSMDTDATPSKMLVSYIFVEGDPK